MGISSSTRLNGFSPAVALSDSDLVYMDQGGEVKATVAQVRTALSSNRAVETFVAGSNFTPGTTASLTLAGSYGSITNIDVYCDGVPQLDCTLSVNTLTFNPVIPIGTQQVVVKGGAAGSIGVPADNSVTSPKIAPGAVSAKLATEAVTQNATGQFYQNAGAKVNRINDRLFVGPAALNLGTNVANQPDWLTQYQLAKGRTYGYVQTSQFTVLNDQASQTSLTTAVFGAKSSPPLEGGSQVIAVTGMGVNNASNGQTANAAWAGYFEAYRDTATAGNGGAYGIEIDTMNFVGSVTTDPYLQGNDQTIGLQLAAGGGFPVSGQFSSSAAVNIQNNNSTFDIGIVFGKDSISGADGTNGTGTAIAFGKGHALQWYAAAGGETSSIVCLGADGLAGIAQRFLDNQVQWVNAGGKNIFQAFGVTGSVNFPAFHSSTAGTPVQFFAAGDDANIDIALIPKGIANVWLGPYTAGALGSATGYITVKDSTGALRRLLTA